MLFFLIAGHTLGDFPLQNTEMATCKCRRSKLPLQSEVPWYYWMTAHALVHALIAGLIVWACTGRQETGILIGLLEFVVHWIIDVLKCENVTNIHIDQALHIICKLTWWTLITQGVLG